MKYLNLTLLLLLVFYGALLLGNNNYLIGLTENHLVEINPTTAETNIITNLNFPNNINTLKNLVYIPNHCLFYTIGNFGQNPSLISISWTGNVNVIGQITLNNDVVYVAEGLTYNTIEEELYVSISTQSLFSSTIAKIDTATAICETVTTVTTLDNDIDSMIFVDYELFIFDGTPNSNISSYYLLDFTNISLNSNPTLLASTIHYSCLLYTSDAADED